MFKRRFADLLLFCVTSTEFGHPLFTDTHLHDHRLDLRPATFHGAMEVAVIEYSGKNTFPDWSESRVFP
jgi:hypothetical protein